MQGFLSLRWILLTASVLLFACGVIGAAHYEKLRDDACLSAFLQDEVLSQEVVEQLARDAVRRENTVDTAVGSTNEQPINCSPGSAVGWTIEQTIDPSRSSNIRVGVFEAIGGDTADEELRCMDEVQYLSVWHDFFSVLAVAGAAGTLLMLVWMGAGLAKRRLIG